MGVENITGSLEWKTEESARLWLLNKVDGFDSETQVMFDIRHFDEDYSTENPDGSEKIPAVTLPCLILRATRVRQLTPKVNMHLMRLETDLWANADDTSATEFQAMAFDREAILQAVGLAQILSAAVSDYEVTAIQNFNLSDKRTVRRHWAQRFDVLLWAQPGS